MDCPNFFDCPDQPEAQLPGFRFHPTDEELVGFYLQRKVDMKPISIDLIKLIDIYKYDPWDLPKSSCTSGDKEWYFFCKRGRKYKNSVRPNRVTGSGFWKATGIDKPVHSHRGDHHLGHNKDNHCIGLKKTLVYYRGSAGKGTKTDWMMHEFRLPVAITDDHNATKISPNNSAQTDNILQEAEIWTLCRIFKRNVSYRKYTPDWRELSTKRSQPTISTNYQKCSSVMESDNYIDFTAPTYNNNSGNYLDHVAQLSSVPTINGGAINNPCNMDCSSSSASSENNEQLFSGYTSWDELRAVVEYAFDPNLA